MQEERRRDENDRDPKREVNPAARRDSERGPEPRPSESEGTEQVPPVQEEPLDPLGPGGIGG